MSDGARAFRAARVPILAEQLAVGFASAVLVGSIEIYLRDAPAGSELAGPGTTLLALFHTVAFYIPAGLLLGALVAGLAALLARSGALAPIRHRSIFAHSPRAFSWAIGALTAIAIVALAGRYGYELL